MSHLDSGSMPSTSKMVRIFKLGSFVSTLVVLPRSAPLKVKVPLDHGPWGPRVLQLVLQLVLHLDTIIQFHGIHVVIPQARVLSQSIPTRRIGGAARVHRTSL